MKFDHLMGAYNPNLYPGDNNLGIALHMLTIPLLFLKAFIVSQTIWCTMILHLTRNWLMKFWTEASWKRNKKMQTNLQCNIVQNIIVG